MTDLHEWKKKNKVDESQKVFIVQGGYNDIKRALKRRGWIQNKDHQSLCFDLKWSLSAKDIPHKAL